MRIRNAATDTALWAVPAVPMVSAGWLGDEDPPRGWWLAAALAVLGAAVALSRRRPLAALAVTAGLGLAVEPALFGYACTPALAAMSFLLGRRAEEVPPALGVYGGVAAAGTTLCLVTDPDPGLLVLGATLLFCGVFPWPVGRYRRQDRALRLAGWEAAPPAFCSSPVIRTS